MSWLLPLIETDFSYQFLHVCCYVYSMWHLIIAIYQKLARWHTLKLCSKQDYSQITTLCRSNTIIGRFQTDLFLAANHTEIIWYLVLLWAVHKENRNVPFIFLLLSLAVIQQLILRWRYPNNCWSIVFQHWYSSQHGCQYSIGEPTGSI